MSKSVFIKSIASDEVHQLFKQVIFKHQAFFSNLGEQVNDGDKSKNPNIYGMKYKDLVQFAIDGDVVAARRLATMVYNGDYFIKKKEQAKEILHELTFGVEGYLSLIHI